MISHQWSIDISSISDHIGRSHLVFPYFCRKDAHILSSFSLMRLFSIIISFSIDVCFITIPSLLSFSILFSFRFLVDLFLHCWRSHILLRAFSKILLPFIFIKSFSPHFSLLFLLFLIFLVFFSSVSLFVLVLFLWLFIISLFLFRGFRFFF